MADVITGATSDVGAGQLSNQVLTAYDRAAFMALRAGVVFDQLADVKPGNVTSPGNPVTFLIWSDLSTATTALSENVDVDAVGLSDSQVTVTPKEYGNAVVKTLRLQTDDYLVGFDADVANIVAFNMVDTIDELARTALDGGTNVDYMGHTAETQILATTELTVAKVRAQEALLRTASAMPWDMNNYFAVIHPHVSHDLKSETGDASWVVPTRYNDAIRIYNNEIGTFAGFRFLETPRAKLNANGGSSTVDSYTTYFMGRQSLAKAESYPAQVVIGPQTDHLRRFATIGWKVYAGWDSFREAALRRVLSASSLGS